MNNTFWIIVLVWFACSASFALGAWWGGTEKTGPDARSI